MYGNVDVNVEPAEPGSGPWRAGRVHMPISFSSTWCGKCHNPFRVLVESAPGQGFVKQPGFGGMVRFWSPIHKVVPGLSVSRTHSSSSIPRKRRRPSHCYIWLTLARTVESTQFWEYVHLSEKTTPIDICRVCMCVCALVSPSISPVTRAKASQCVCLLTC
jgi:hypothetical protein